MAYGTDFQKNNKLKLLSKKFIKSHLNIIIKINICQAIGYYTVMYKSSLTIAYIAYSIVTHEPAN